MPSLSALSGSSGSSSKASSSGRRSFFRRRSRRPSTLVSESTVHDAESATDHDDAPANDASRRPAWRPSTASHSSAVAHHLHHHGDHQHRSQHDHGHEDGATAAGSATAAPESGRKPTGMLAKAALWTFTALAVVAVTPFRLAHAVGLDGSSDSSSSHADARRSTSREPAAAGAASAPPLPPPRASTASAAAARMVTLALHDDAGAARMSHDVHRLPPPMSPLVHSLDEDSELEDDDWQDEPRGRSRKGAALSAVVLPARTVSLGSPVPALQGSPPSTSTGPQQGPSRMMRHGRQIEAHMTVW
ncbi:hypothetical protein AMAG_17771 [Allomyces macrogynus ATCC 38327]|uniref:Uncharacterized protein n=1 Tax=Allomyces macrogynus (strain ATCC 38327) TaxID=578462 RepID=A0A0L0RZ05_ALLM3|nr:hypothetical protein AMAG_17771 [Allomyces macrogynus ATCC 38327]|eukprot:KNE55309.1 hypothetical protein AMAG_17771 [Allomyces macrogynus ATCC 38327]